MSQQYQMVTLSLAIHLHPGDVATTMPQLGPVLLLKKEDTDENTECTSLGSPPLWKSSRSINLEGGEIQAKQSVISFGFFPVAACGMSLQFSCILQELLPPEICTSCFSETHLSQMRTTSEWALQEGRCRRL